MSDEQVTQSEAGAARADAEAADGVHAPEAGGTPASLKAEEAERAPEITAGVDVGDGESRQFESLVDASTGTVLDTREAGETPAPLKAEEAERAPEITAAGTLVLEGAESQAAAGAVNELQVVREKLSTLQTSLDLVRVAIDNITERLSGFESKLKAADQTFDFLERWHKAHTGDVEKIKADLSDTNKNLETLALRVVDLSANQAREIAAVTTLPGLKKTLLDVAAQGDALVADAAATQNAASGRPPAAVKLSAAVESAVDPRTRAALLEIARQVEAVGGDKVVNLVRNTLDGVAAGG